MDIQDLIKQVGGLQSVASELGITPQQAQTGTAALLPHVLSGFQNKAQAPGGLPGLGGLLSQLGGGGLLDNVLSPQPTNVGLGNDVLGHIFGSKEVSRDVASQAASTSGLDPSLLRKLLPIVAMLAAGYMAKRAGNHPEGAAGGGLSSVLGGLLGGGGAGGASPGMGGALDSVLGGLAGKFKL